MNRRRFLRTSGLAAAGLLLPEQASAKGYDCRYDDGHLVYTFDLTRRLLVTCIVSEDGAGLEGFRYRIRKDYVEPGIARPLLAFTGGFSEGNGRKSIGGIVVNQELVTSGCSEYEYQSVIFQRNNGMPDFYFDGVNETYGNNFTLRRGGYARLLPFSDEIWERDIRPYDVANRIAIGTRPANGRKKIVVHTGPMNVSAAANFMHDYGCTEAVLSDGGDSYARISWIDDSRPQHPRRNIKDLMVFMELL